MNVIYEHFIRQVKAQQIQQYNRKHRDYLIRAGKMKHPNTVYIPQYSSNQNRNQTNNQRDHPKPTEQRNYERKPRRQREFQVKKQIIATVINPQTIYIDQVQNTTNQPIGLILPHIQQETQQSNMREDREQIHINYNRENSLQQKNEQNIDMRVLSVQKQQPPEQQFQQLQLLQCPSGCGRKFAPKVLAKHAKICQKVFQEKRKPFEVQKIDQEAQKFKQKNESRNQANEKKANQKKANEKKAKWKKQSDMFRNQMKMVRGEASEPIEDDRIQCPICSRKFNQVAAEKHIQFCKKKSQQKK